MANTNEIFADVKRAISDRADWSSRLGTWYEMRHDGLRRSNKPWPGAADMHFPLADTVISKLKPYYFEQLFATETIASFVPRSPQDVALTTAAAHWFDYKLKQCSNIEPAALMAIDTMLQTGRGFLKVVWCPEEKQVKFESVDAQDIIVPASTECLSEASHITHVFRLTREQFKAMKFDGATDEYIDSVCGGQLSDNDPGAVHAIRGAREGVTHSNSRDIIVLWETYTRVPGKDQWQFITYSPRNPDVILRKIALDECCCEPPFVDFPYEIKDKGFYSSRGVVELVAPFEAALCKTWNEKLDAMTLFNRPMYRSEREVANTGALRMKPGGILPHGLQPVQAPQPPMSFDQEMVSTRMVAEQRVAMPDFGIGQSINTKDRKTATEVNAIGELMSNSTDLRMRIFRMGLGKLYRIAWRLLVENDSASLKYFFEGTPYELPPDALKAGYSITPTGSADGVNKSFLYQKAVTRLQMFNNDPFIRQDQLRRSVLEADDPALARRLMTDPGLEQQYQTEDQANEITYLKLGFPARVLPTDDHAAHIMCIAHYLEQRQLLGEEVSQLEVQRLNEHIAQHFDALAQSNPKKAKEIAAIVQQIVARNQPQEDMNEPADPMSALPQGQPGVPPMPMAAGGVM